MNSVSLNLLKNQLVGGRVNEVEENSLLMKRKRETRAGVETISRLRLSFRNSNSARWRARGRNFILKYNFGVRGATFTRSREIFWRKIRSGAYSRKWNFRNLSYASRQYLQSSAARKFRVTKYYKRNLGKLVFLRIRGKISPPDKGSKFRPEYLLPVPASAALENCPEVSTSGGVSRAHKFPYPTYQLWVIVALSKEHFFGKLAYKTESPNPAK